MSTRKGSQQYNINLSCKYYGTPKVNANVQLGFDTDKVQAQDTIIIAKHDVSSAKNRHHFSFLKRTPTSNNSPSWGRYKTTMSKCRCPFSI